MSSVNPITTPHQARITTFPQNSPEECLYSSDVVSFAQDIGLYPKGAAAAEFCKCHMNKVKEWTCGVALLFCYASTCDCMCLSCPVILLSCLSVCPSCNFMNYTSC